MEVESRPSAIGAVFSRVMGELEDAGFSGEEIFAVHLALQEALGYPHPEYGHLPLIFNMQGKKLSKRDGDVEVHAFRAAGYLPEVMANFIALLGWSPGEDREKMTLPEMIELFGLEGVDPLK